MTYAGSGKLFECIGVDMRDLVEFQPSIVDALNEAKGALKDVKTFEELREWAIYWFGEE